MSIINLDPEHTKTSQFIGLAATPDKRKGRIALIAHQTQDGRVLISSLTETLIGAAARWCHQRHATDYHTEHSDMGIIQAYQAQYGLNATPRFRIHPNGELTDYKNESDVIAVGRYIASDISRGFKVPHYCGTANLVRPDIVSGYRGTLPKAESRAFP